MSFWSAVGRAFTGVNKATTAIDPFLNVIGQLPIGGPFGTIVSNIIHVEQLAGAFTAKGADKKALVTQLVTLAYPTIDKEALSKAIDGIVTILNDLAKATPTQLVEVPK